MSNTFVAIENDGSMWVSLEDFKKVEANYDALQSPMPCGHLARYAVNDKDGTQYCVMCEVIETRKENNILSRHITRIMGDE